MKRQIIVTIEPHEDGVRCGECEGIDGNGGGNDCWFSEELVVEDGALIGVDFIRGPLCLASEAKLKRLIEAGENLSAMNDEITKEDSMVVIAWDRAVEEAKK